LDVCPRCKAHASKLCSEAVATPIAPPQENTKSATGASAGNDGKTNSRAVVVPASSTLIEFPGVSRASRPVWRAELSERVREIQERRARDAEAEAEEAAQRLLEEPVEDFIPQLGLVPPHDAPAMNPIVAAALKRLERARQSPSIARTRGAIGGSAAAAVARVAQEQCQTELQPPSPQVSTASSAPALAPAPRSKPQRTVDARPLEPGRGEHSLIVVPPQPAKKVSLPESKPQPKLVKPIEQVASLPSTRELHKPEFEEEIYNDRAPVLHRVVGSVIDVLVVAFASSPFAAVIELTNGNWSDWRVIASMGGIVLVVMFLYLTTATALAGRTWGMSVLSLRAVDADTGLWPTTGQAAGRAILYIISLITLGLGVLYALFDAESRTAHDRLSGTAVVRE